MKAIKQIVFGVFTLFCVSVLLSSCSEKEDGNKTPAATFNYGLSPFITNGEILKVEEVYLSQSGTTEGAYIESITWYFDDEKISVVESAPFSMSYPIENQEIGVHELKFIALVKCDGYKPIDYTVKTRIYVLEEPLVVAMDMQWDDETILQNGVSNGQTISGQVTLSERTTIDVTIRRFEFYWDEELFDAGNTDPCEFEYVLSGQEVGNHMFKAVMYVDTEYGSMKINSEYGIRVLS